MQKELHHDLGLGRTTAAFPFMGATADIAVIHLYHAGKLVIIISLANSGTDFVKYMPG